LRLFRYNLHPSPSWLIKRSKTLAFIYIRQASLHWLVKVPL